MIVDELNKCLRSELASVETYQQALEKHGKAHEHDASYQQLSQMLQDHREAADRLRTLIQQLGGTPSEDSGAWGTWSQTVMGSAKLFGDKAALKALKEGEESGLKQYQSITEDTTAPADAKSVITTIMERERRHVGELDRLMEAA